MHYYRMETEARHMAHTANSRDEAGGRYASIETSDGELVIYDHEQPSAWLRSDHTVDIRA